MSKYLNFILSKCRTQQIKKTVPENKNW